MRRLSRRHARDTPRDRPPGAAVPAYRVVLWVAVLMIALLYALWYGNAREVEALDAETRQKLGGTYIELEDGVTHFRVEGPYEGPLFVLVHGGTMAMFVWEEQVRALTAAGFQVLRYDAFGHGYSDRPDTDYTLAFSVKQLSEMIQRFSGGEPVHLAGVSVGGLIAAAYAARYPERVARLSLISPVVRGVPSARGLTAILARIPGIGEFAMRVFGMNRLVSRARSMLARMPENGERMRRLFFEQMRYRGYERAILSTVRGDLLRDQRRVYERLGRTEVPVQVLWGRDDREISPKDMAIVREAVPRLTFRAMPDAGHGLLIQRGERVSEALAGFHRTAGEAEPPP